MTVAGITHYGPKAELFEVFVETGVDPVVLQIRIQNARGDIKYNFRLYF
jgi:hypothetical protein